MPTCLVHGCRSGSSSRSERISYHSLPKNAELARLWLEICGRTDLIGSKSYDSAKVCSVHFEKSDYRNHLQYVLKPTGSISSKPRLKDDAVPKFVKLGWKKPRTTPPEIKIAPRLDVQQQHVSDALRDYDHGQLYSSGVEEIRHKLKMRRPRRETNAEAPSSLEPEPSVIVQPSLSPSSSSQIYPSTLTPVETLNIVPVGRRGGRATAGGRLADIVAGSPAARAAASGGGGPRPRVLTSKGFAAQLAAGGADDLDRQARQLLRREAAGGARKTSAKTAAGEAAESGPGEAGGGEAWAGPSTGEGVDPLPPGMPGRLRSVLGRQRTLCSLRLTLSRQAAQLQALQARCELEWEEQAHRGAPVELFPPLEPGLAEPGDAGEMLLSPVTLEEATAELHALRGQVMGLRAQLLETAAEANERALAANGQTAALLRVFTPRQLEVLLGKRAEADVAWTSAELRRALALRRVLTRRQYEHVRRALRLPLPSSCPAAGAAHADRETAQLYRLLVRPGEVPATDVNAVVSSVPRGGAARGRGGTSRRRDLLVLPGASQDSDLEQGQWDDAEVDDDVEAGYGSVDSGLLIQPSVSDVVMDGEHPMDGMEMGDHVDGVEGDVGWMKSRVKLEVDDVDEVEEEVDDVDAELVYGKESDANDVTGGVDYVEYELYNGQLPNVKCEVDTLEYEVDEEGEAGMAGLCEVGGVEVEPVEHEVPPPRPLGRPRKVAVTPADPRGAQQPESHGSLWAEFL